MSIAIIANGTLLKIGDGASPEEFTTVPEMMKIAGPSVKFDLLDVTSHDSAGFFREYIPGLADGDNIAGTFNWRPSNTVHIALRTDSYARTLRNFETIFPDDTDNTVSTANYIQTISPTADIGAVLVASLTLKVTGLPAWS
jgi:acetoacetate decarboxylase